MHYSGSKAEYHAAETDAANEIAWKIGMDNIFELLMFLVVVGTSVFRFIKARKSKKVQAQLCALAPILNTSIDSGGRSISGKIDEVPFKVKYEPAVEKLPEKVNVTFEKALPFTLQIEPRQDPFDPRAASEAGETLLEDRKFDERFSVLTDNPEACREYLLDPLFNQGVQLVLAEGYSLRFTRRRAVITMHDAAWLSHTETAATSLKRLLQLGYSLIAEF